MVCAVPEPCAGGLTCCSTLGAVRPVLTDALAGVCRAYDLGETRSGPPEQVRQVRAARLEFAAGDRGVDVGHEAGGRLIKAGPPERVGILLG